MKKLLLLILPVFLFACGSTEQKQSKPPAKKNGVEENPLQAYKGPDYEAINNCLRTTLSYKMQVEPRDYDSLATYYFHEIRDYTNPETRRQNIQLKRYRELLKDSATFMKPARVKEIEGQVDILQQEVNAHLREVIGYVFVHSFVIRDKDTLSGIFVMDRSCGYKEFIRVKVISDPNPEDYVESIRSIER